MTESVTDICVPLAEQRAVIDAIDDALLRLLAARFAAVARVAAIKQAHGLPARIPARINQVQHRVLLAAERLHLSPPLIKILWEILIEEACLAEEAAGVRAEI